MYNVHCICLHKSERECRYNQFTVCINEKRIIKCLCVKLLCRICNLISTLLLLRDNNVARYGIKQRRKQNHILGVVIYENKLKI